MKKIKKVTMGDQECDVHFGKYMDGKTYIELVCYGGDDDGCLYATATTNLRGLDLDEDEVLIKNYSENEGVLPALIDAGIVQDTGKKVNVGYAHANICKLIN